MEDTDWRPSKCPECGAWREAARNPVCESSAENRTPDEEDSPMSETDQKQAPELLMKRKFFDVRDLTTRDSGEYYISEIEALAKQRDELAAEVERLRCMNPNPGNQRYWEGRYRDEKADNGRLAAERDQALAVSAAREIAMRDRAAEVADMFDAKCIRALPLSPDGQQALDDMLAEAWDEGFLSGCGKKVTTNPYRKDGQK